MDNSPPNDNQETSDEQSPPIKVQMENVRLQRHIQFLQKQISQSKPTNLTCSTEEQMHTESTRTDTKTRTIKNRNADNLKKNTSKRMKQSVTILGDSLINYQDEVCHSNKNRIVIVRSFPGATTEDILDHCKPIARKKPDIIILHVGTNDLKSNEESSIVKNIVEIKETIKKISPLTKTMISLIISRYDSELLNDKAIIVNERLTQRFPKTEIIDNSNLHRECVGLKGLHLNRVRNRHLAMNFKQVLNNI